MNVWGMFWGATIIVALTAFAILSIVVTIGGWSDLKTLLARRPEPSDDVDKSKHD